MKSAHSEGIVSLFYKEPHVSDISRKCSCRISQRLQYRQGIHTVKAIWAAAKVCIHRGGTWQIPHSSKQFKFWNDISQHTDNLSHHKHMKHRHLRNGQLGNVRSSYLIFDASIPLSALPHVDIPTAGENRTVNNMTRTKFDRPTAAPKVGFATEAHTVNQV